jgi:hypothetical protein
MLPRLLRVLRAGHDVVHEIESEKVCLLNSSQRAETSPAVRSTITLPSNFRPHLEQRRRNPVTRFFDEARCHRRMFDPAGLPFAPFRRDNGGMLELIIERWSGKDGTRFRWSLWRDGKRLVMGPDHATVDLAEAQATALCIQEFGARPDRVTRL